MSARRGPGLSALAIAAMLTLAGWAWVRAPAQVPTHYDLSGEPDRWGSPLTLFLPMPIVTAFVTLVLWGAPRLDPRAREQIERSSAYLTLWAGVVGALTLLHAAMVLGTLGLRLAPATLVSLIVGFLYLLMGSVVHTIRPNTVFGVRTPATLRSELSWRKTHRLMRPLMIGYGLLQVGAGLLPGLWPAIATFALGHLALLTTAFVYSQRVAASEPADPDAV